MKRIWTMILLTSIVLWADFTRDANTEIVTDNSRGLEWQDDLSAYTKGAPWEEAIEYCEALTLDGTGWRLPNYNELYSLIDRSRDPAIDSAFLHVGTRNYYFTSTSYANNPLGAWQLYFKAGLSRVNFKTGFYHVRCVRTKK